jgi:hypothetical protein
MRQIFGGAMVFSVIGAIILGAALAWTTSQSTGEQSVFVGNMAWTLHYSTEDVKLGPNGVTTYGVGDGYIDNNGDFPLTVASGAVFIDSTNPPLDTPPPPANSCPINNFTGALRPLGIQPMPPLTNGTGNLGDPGTFQVDITTASGAPVECAGMEVEYHVRVDVQT